MLIVGGLDIHRKQLTFDYLDTETGDAMFPSLGRAWPIRPCLRALSPPACLSKAGSIASGVSDLAFNRPEKTGCFISGLSQILRSEMALTTFGIRRL